MNSSNSNLSTKNSSGGTNNASSSGNTSSNSSGANSTSYSEHEKHLSSNRNSSSSSNYIVEACLQSSDILNDICALPSLTIEVRFPFSRRESLTTTPVMLTPVLLH
jgi:hypothetical protein